MLVLCLALCGSCGQSGSGAGDATSDTGVVPPLHDGQAGGEGGSAGSVIDFVVQGCPKRAPGRCEGRVPLTLTFSAMVEAPPLSVSWTFGDGSNPGAGQIVTHTYTLPGNYDVTLTVGDASGTTHKQKSGFVVIRPAGAGAMCAAHNICDSGTCICFETCPFPLNRGVCLYDCTQWPKCPEGLACVDLGQPSPSGTDPWRTSLCLPTCGTGLKCERPDFTCQWAPTVNEWQRVCLPPLLRSIGEPCFNDQGQADPSLAVGGLCLSLGSSGYSTTPCSAGTCPADSRCAVFGGGPQEPVCLARCPGGGCGHDPLLACTPPGGQGDYGFTILGTPDPKGTSYCSAKECDLDQECGLTGRCNLDIGGYCAPK